MDSEQVLEHVSIPLAKIAKSIGDTAERGQKKTKAESFIKTCQSHAIIEESSPRHTLS